MTSIANWPGSQLEQATLIDEIGKFLRTHRNGTARLLEWLESCPPDRTEDEYRAVAALSPFAE